MAEVTPEQIQKAVVSALLSSGLPATLERLDRLESVLTGEPNNPGLLTQVALINQNIDNLKEQGVRVETYMVGAEADRRKIMGTLAEMEIAQYETSNNMQAETARMESSVEQINVKLLPLLEWRDNIATWIIKGGAITAGVSFVFGGIIMFVFNYFGVLQATFKLMSEVPK